MIEFSIGEIALFCWAALATGYALKWKTEAEGAHFFARMLIERKEVRDKIVAEYEEFKAGLGQ